MRALILAAAAAAIVMGGATARAQMPAPAEIIKAWDKDGDGTVDRAEWAAAGRPAERFDLVDANHDGKITAEELAAAMARMRNGGAGGANGGGRPAPQAPAQPAQAQPPAGGPH